MKLKQAFAIFALMLNPQQANARLGETTGLRKPQSENNNPDQQVCLTGPFKEEQAQITFTWDYTLISCLTDMHPSLSTQTDPESCNKAIIDYETSCGGNGIIAKVNPAAKDMLTLGPTPIPTPAPTLNPTERPTHEGETNTPTPAPTQPPTNSPMLPKPLPTHKIVAGTNALAAATLALEASVRNYGIIPKSLAALLQCSPMLGVHNDPAAKIQNPSDSVIALSNSASNSMKADITYSIAQAALIIANIDKPSNIITALIIEANLANMIDNSVSLII